MWTPYHRTYSILIFGHPILEAGANPSRRSPIPIHWADHRSIAELTRRRTAVHTHIPIYRQFRVASRPDLHVCGRLEETRAPTGRTCKLQTGWHD